MTTPGPEEKSIVPLRERPRATESDLDMARRHVREAADRLARQEGLIATRLERFDNPNVIRLSMEPLETLRMTVRVALQHLRIVESMRPEALPAVAPPMPAISLEQNLRAQVQSQLARLPPPHRIS
jgi:hypothetical protein